MDTTSRTDASTSYVEAHRASLQDRDRFWLDAARAVDWSVAPTRAVDDSMRRCTVGSPTEC